MLDFLTELATHPQTVGAAVGILLSTAIETFQWAWFDRQTHRMRRFVYGALCVAVPVLARLLLIVYLGEGVDSFRTFADYMYPSVQAGVTAFAAGTLYHSRYLGKKLQQEAERDHPLLRVDDAE